MTIKCNKKNKSFDLPTMKSRNIHSNSISSDDDGTPEPPSPANTPIATDPCIVCGGNMNSKYPILSCAGCQVCIHTDCYGITNVKPMNKMWRCDPCLNIRIRCAIKIKKCLLCDQPEGTNNSLKRTNGNNWVHVLCSAFIPEVTYYDAKKLFVAMDVDDIDKEYWNAVCTICKSSAGACVKCSYYDQCRNFFHVTCAREAGYNIGFEVKSFNNNIGDSNSPKYDKVQTTFSSNNFNKAIKLLGRENNNIMISDEYINISEKYININHTQDNINKSTAGMPVHCFGNGLDGEMIATISCHDHGNLPYNFVGLSTRDLYTCQSAIYVYIKEYKQYDTSSRESKIKKRYKLTVPKKITDFIDLQKPWFSRVTEDMDIDSIEAMIKEEEKNSTEMNINQMMCKDNEYSNDNHQLKKSRIISTSSPTYKCMKCSINKSLKWWPENWKSLTKDSRHKISDLNNVGSATKTFPPNKFCILNGLLTIQGPNFIANSITSGFIIELHTASMFQS
ncbi:399_t:CDS:2, partial [Entrophospora sp. SA101]